MLGSGIIDIAIGLAFVFGVTAALSSVFTELIARFLGLRGAYLLSGLRELLDGTGGQTPGTGSQTALKDSIKNYEAMKDLMQPPVRAAAGRAKPAAPAAPALLPLRLLPLRLLPPHRPPPRPPRPLKKIRPRTNRPRGPRPAHCLAARSCGVRGWSARSPPGI